MYLDHKANTPSTCQLKKVGFSPPRSCFMRVLRRHSLLHSDPTYQQTFCDLSIHQSSNLQLRLVHSKVKADATRLRRRTPPAILLRQRSLRCSDNSRLCIPFLGKYVSLIYIYNERGGAARRFVSLPQTCRALSFLSPLLSLNRWRLVYHFLFLIIMLINLFLTSSLITQALKYAARWRSPRSLA